MKENKFEINPHCLFKRGIIIPDKLYHNNVFNFLEEVRKANPQNAYTIDLLNMKKPKRVWEALTGQYEDGGKLTDEDYTEKVKKFLKWRTIGPEEWSYIENYKLQKSPPIN